MGAAASRGFGVASAAVVSIFHPGPVTRVCAPRSSKSARFQRRARSRGPARGRTGGRGARGGRSPTPCRQQAPGRSPEARRAVRGQGRLGRRPCRQPPSAAAEGLVPSGWSPSAQPWRGQRGLAGGWRTQRGPLAPARERPGQRSPGAGSRPRAAGSVCLGAFADQGPLGNPGSATPESWPGGGRGEGQRASQSLALLYVFLFPVRRRLVDGGLSQQHRARRSEVCF